MNTRKFQTLNSRLIQLLKQEEELFLLERPSMCNWLELEQLQSKYPDLGESIESNKLGITAVIDQLSKLIKGNYNGPNTPTML